MIRFALAFVGVFALTSLASACDGDNALLLQQGGCGNNAALFAQRSLVSRSAFLSSQQQVLLAQQPVFLGQPALNLNILSAGRGRGRAFRRVPARQFQQRQVIRQRTTIRNRR